MLCYVVVAFVVVVVVAGCRQNHGDGLGPYAALRQEVHHDEGQHPGGQPQDPDAQVQQQYGDGNEGGHESHGHHEQTGQSWLLLNSSINCKKLVSSHRLWQTFVLVDSLEFTMVSPQLKLPQIQKIMMEFEKQSEIMEMKEEMMNDAIDDAMGDEDDEDER